MSIQDTELDKVVEHMQQVLEREYAYLEWRVLVQTESGAGTAAEPWVFVHARTRGVRPSDRTMTDVCLSHLM